MKKIPLPVFPVFFALLTLFFFLILYHDALHPLGMTSALLVFFTALGWSALIVLGQGNMPAMKVIFALAAFLASLLLIEVFRPFPVDPLQHRLMVLVQVLGMAGIILYLHILKRKGEPPHE